jgi:uncharacterized LabA/DUF88 family protein
MPIEPSIKRAVTFIDGQNLFHCAKQAFGHSYPNYDVEALSRIVCIRQGWELDQARFYTGIPEAADNAFWNYFWAGRLAVMGRQEKIHVFSRHLRYRNRVVRLHDGSTFSYRTGEEKGIDVRICIDIIRLAHEKVFDVALIFSQDQDLSEVAEEIRKIAREQDRWIKVASAFPFNPDHKFRRGIDRTDWIRIDRAMYDACLDTRDYRPKEVAEPLLDE